MKFRKFVQCGDNYQCSNNGMDGYEYSFGANNGKGDFCILRQDGVSGPYWSIGKSYSTSFKLELKFDDIPF